jgi:hypothetical protein
VHKIALRLPSRETLSPRTFRVHEIIGVSMDLGRLAITVGVRENNPWRAAALLLTLGRVGGVGLANDARRPSDEGLDEGLGSWFRLRNELRGSQSRVA